MPAIEVEGNIEIQICKSYRELRIHGQQVCQTPLFYIFYSLDSLITFSKVSQEASARTRTQNSGLFYIT